MIKGYKVFNPDWTCRDFQYEVGKTYEMEGRPIICEKGFHFCKEAVKCFRYYSFDSDNRVAEIEAYGEIDENGGDKYCTNKIKIVRELNWYEVLNLVNTGKGCSGRHNSGNYNSGNRNSGNCNSGDHNRGDLNSGCKNNGDRNSGNHNSGDWNSGSRNRGSWNAGNCNDGHRNSGDYNSGDHNSGTHNSGDWNTGDWNFASNCTGCFNTVDQPIMFFDKPSLITLEEWRESEAYRLLSRVDLRPADWVWSSDMTTAEKGSHPEHAITGGYLKIRGNSDRPIEWWNGLTDRKKAIIKAIPNFDAEKFSEIMSIPLDLLKQKG